jgi:hypothetical protein
MLASSFSARAREGKKKAARLLIVIKIIGTIFKIKIQLITLQYMRSVFLTRN